jgi:hypothetical protein
VDTKNCHRCRQSRPLTDYNRDRSKPDGYKDICRSCRYDERRGRRASAKGDAYEAALEQLKELHPRLFASLLYSEYIRRGIVTVDDRKAV